MDVILNIVKTINSYLSDYILIFLLVGIGIFFTIKTKFIQVRCFGEGMKNVFGKISLNGKKQNIRRKDFIILADSIGITEKSAEKMIEKIVKLKDKYIAMCRESYMPDDMKEALENLIENRIAILEK